LYIPEARSSNVFQEVKHTKVLRSHELGKARSSSAK
jgi:hypothetical protein